MLRLFLNDYENGFNYGFLLGDKIVNLFENYVINSTFGGSYGYAQARQIFDEKFIVDDKYIEISQGMIEGIKAAEVSLYSPTLDDTLTYKDVLIANSIPDFTAFSKSWNNKGPGCSDIASFGEATMDDPELEGETVISRNLDWDNDPILIENSLLILWAGGGADRQMWISFGFAGMIGALSGVNESGIATFQNMGNHYMSPSGTSFYPVNLAQRNGLEMEDYNNDGLCTPRDVTDAVRAHNVASTYIINTAGPSWLDHPAEILEIHNAIGEAVRTVDDNIGDFGDNLVSTNHFRKLMPPAYCYRYSRISDSLELSNQMTVYRNWNVLQTAGVSTNLQTIQFIPHERVFRFSFAEIGTPAYLIEPTEVFMDTLKPTVGIAENTIIDHIKLSVYPNPCTRNNSINIETDFDVPAHFTCTVSDYKGRILKDFGSNFFDGEVLNLSWNTTRVANGIYFVNINFKNQSHQHITRKVVVSR